MNAVTEFLGNLKVLVSSALMKPFDPEERGSIGAMVEGNALQSPNAPALYFEDQMLTWSEFNSRSNHFARYLQTQGVQHGDCVSLMMHNRIEFLVCLVGIIKLGAIAGLINTNLRHAQLVHCISLIDSKKCIFGEEVSLAISEVMAELPLNQSEDYIFLSDGKDSINPDWSIKYDANDHSLGDSNLEECSRVIYKDTAYYVFTSGTTGLPKAAILSHMRGITQGITSSKLLQRQTAVDRMYNCLPLYHATGLNIGWLSTVCTGASTVIRRKLSISAFWDDIHHYQCTSFVYIGEFLRYLMSRPEQPSDATNTINKIVGNGLRPDIWMAFRQRFAIERIGEFYGASEGNGGFGNVLNKDCTVGMGDSPLMLAKYDVDNDCLIRDANNHCIPAASGEPGLLLLKITEKAHFEGYTSQEATSQKIIKDADESGASYFNTGDLMKEVDVGFTFGLKHYQFVDRTGDTFRWKSENVSTTEVGEIINQHRDIEITNVYGVEIPGTDGRAGMASLVLKDGLSASSQMDLQGLTDLVRRDLPGYAQPLFLRILQDQPTTTTMKLLKSDLREQAYHPDKSQDEILFLAAGSSCYAPLEETTYQQIMDAKLTL